MSEVFRLRDQVEWRVVEGEVLALDVAAQTYLSSNRTGSILWSVLQHLALPPHAFLGDRRYEPPALTVLGSVQQLTSEGDLSETPK